MTRTNLEQISERLDWVENISRILLQEDRIGKREINLYMPQDILRNSMKEMLKRQRISMQV